MTNEQRIAEYFPKDVANHQMTVSLDSLYEVARAVTSGYDYNPGDSDLDDEQPIHVQMTLGDYRKAARHARGKADG